MKLSKIPLVLEAKYSLSFPFLYQTLVCGAIIYKQGMNSKAGLQSLSSPSTQQLDPCDSISDVDMPLKFPCQKEV